MVVPNYWETPIYKENAEVNMKNVEFTIDDLNFHERKIMVCGRAYDTHPDFFPRFSTPTANIDSTLYVGVDHHSTYADFITRKGTYALGLIVDPIVPKKILSLGGKIYWFSPEYFDYEIPTIYFGRNSGLAAIALASYFRTEYVLLSGINLSGDYSQFKDGQKIVFNNATELGTQIFSLDGVLAEKINFEDWCKL